MLLVLVIISCGPGNGVPDRVSRSRSRGDYLGRIPPGSSPELFAPGLVSTKSNEGGAVVYPPKNEIYFWVVGKSKSDGKVKGTIYVTKERDGVWTHPEIVSFSGRYNDSYIALHPDGSRLYFQSSRPIDPNESKFEYNIWYAERKGEGWSEAKSMGQPINGVNHTGGASVTRDGTLYFTIMDIKSGASQLYRSRFVKGEYVEPEKLSAEVNSFYQTCDSYVAPDETYLVFTAFERQGHADNPGRLYVAFRDSAGGWKKARVMGPAINSKDQFGSATISPDGRYLFFPQFNYADNMGLDIYWVDTKVVHDMDI